MNDPKRVAKGEKQSNSLLPSSGGLGFATSAYLIIVCQLTAIRNTYTYTTQIFKMNEYDYVLHLHGFF